MNSIESHIRYLLIGNGHVAVPGIGVLSRSWLPASFEGDRLIAPSETVSFQPDDSCDGSSLIASVARAESIPMAEAAAKVSAASAGWIHRLSLGMSVDIAEVGTLNAVTSDGSIAFVPDVNSVGSRALPWLPALALEPITVSETADADGHDSAPAHSDAFMRSLRRTATSAAAIAIMVLIAFIASQMPRSPRSAEPTYASLPIEPIASISVPERRGIIERPGNPDKSLVLILNTPADAKTEATPAAASPREEEAPQPRYCLVVASLYSASEAKDFISNSSASDDLRLLEKDGRFRVFAAQGASIAAVQELARSEGLYDRYPNAWICRK